MVLYVAVYCFIIFFAEVADSKAWPRDRPTATSDSDLSLQQ